MLGSTFSEAEHRAKPLRVQEVGKLSGVPATSLVDDDDTQSERDGGLGCSILATAFLLLHCCETRYVAGIFASSCRLS